MHGALRIPLAIPQNRKKFVADFSESCDTARLRLFGNI
jgi:hypothetical protein